jgi:TetR/AcrR family transcriptional regulator, regulator of autoinduction and epiphytic fitness
MSEPLTYHRRIAVQKRSAIVDAALRLFATDGYGGTSLARVATEAQVSTATLFKQFPTKDDLFEAIVTEFWQHESPPRAALDPRHPRSALLELGRQYAALLRKPGMAGLHRMVISEAPRFPQLARIQFDLGKEPFFNQVHGFLVNAADAGTLRVDDATVAATQFLGMISNFVLWPTMLLVDWSPSPLEVEHTIDEAVATFLSRYGSDGAMPGLV